VNVLQLLDDVVAVVATTTSESWVEEGSTGSSGLLSPDRTQLVVDVGASSSTISVICYVKDLCMFSRRLRHPLVWLAVITSIRN
jgi:hypothetical protein